MQTQEKRSVGSFVASDYRTAAVFQKYGIDFCCKGGQTIDEVCTQRQLSIPELLAALEDVSHQPRPQDAGYQSWTLDKLADHIEEKHHHYVEQTTPVLKQFLAKLCTVHGSRHPELFKIREQFDAAAGELAAHMKKEEFILFPQIRKMAAAHSAHQRPERPPFGTLQNPIHMMMEEHNVEGERFGIIAQLSDNYAPPPDACTTYRVSYSMLREFEEDLHLHIHLENNILFPKSISLEHELLG